MFDTEIQLAKLIRKQASPQVLAQSQASVQELVDNAQTTANPFDDFFAMMLQLIVGKPGETPQ